LRRPLCHSWQLPKPSAKFDPHTFLSTINGGRKIAAFLKKQTIFAQGDSSGAVFYLIVFILSSCEQSVARNNGNMTYLTHKAKAKLRKAPQPPLSHAGATADADRAKKPPLVQTSAFDAELNPGDRVMGLADFGKPTGEFGTVEKTNEDDALVKWDDDGRVRLRQPWLQKI
jgi:hypothetical protein